jgi:membrane protease YdiL (CAAX protease family)
MKEQLYGLLIFFAASVATLPILVKKKLFSVPTQPVKKGLSPIFTLVAFALYLGSSLLVRCFARLLSYLSRSFAYHFTDLQIGAFAQILTICSTFLLLAMLVYLQSDAVKVYIWGTRQMSACWRYLLKGIFLCLLAYPVVMCLVQLVHIAVNLVGHFPQKDQLVLTQLKELRGTPVLFWSFAFLIVTFIPFVEELLFRALLQSTLLTVLQPFWAVVLTSAIFSLFHYSDAQLVTNIELLLGLFAIAYVMGIAYLRYRSLWVSIGMHATFNLLSLSFFILLG